MTEALRRIARGRSIPILRRDASRGQIIVLFALTLVAIVGAVGLVIDGGSAWAQRRNQQRVADLAALAAARAEANGALRNDIIAAAIDTAEANGILADDVTVNIPPTQGEYATTTRDCSPAEQVPCWIVVVVDRAHANTFSRVMGQDSWQVSTRAVSYTAAWPLFRLGIASSPWPFGIHAVQCWSAKSPMATTMDLLLSLSFGLRITTAASW